MLREAKVTLLSNGPRHSLVVRGSSLFEAAGWALAHFVSNGYLPPGATSQAALHVQLGDKTWQVRAVRIERWLREVDCDDTRKGVIKQQIWRAMTER